MRIDKFLSSCGVASRTEASKAARRGELFVNGDAVSDVSRHIDPERDRILFRGEEIAYAAFVYIMLNKPTGYVSATEDRSLPPVTDLLDARLQKIGLFPCGRLDRDTTGLLILTNDGQSAHDLLSPKHHVEKEYAFTCASPLPADAEARVLAGMTVGGEQFKSAVLACSEDRTSGRITLTEGKYHEIKRMFAAMGNKITTLSRISFAGIPLDPTLAPGAWRPCTKDEIAILTSHRTRQNHKETEKNT